MTQGLFELNWKNRQNNFNASFSQWQKVEEIERMRHCTENGVLIRTLVKEEAYQYLSSIICTGFFLVDSQIDIDVALKL